MEAHLQVATQAYKKSAQEGLAPVLQYDYITKAIRSFTDAQNHASTIDSRYDKSQYNQRERGCEKSMDEAKDIDRKAGYLSGEIWGYHPSKQLR